MIFSFLWKGGIALPCELQEKDVWVRVHRSEMKGNGYFGALALAMN
jgi:hypothetical protein